MTSINEKSKLDPGLKTVLELKRMMARLEKDLGLSDLSTLENDVLMALIELVDGKGFAKTSQIVEHEFLIGYSRSSTFRALKALEELHMIAKYQNKNGSYTIV